MHEKIYKVKHMTAMYSFFWAFSFRYDRYMLKTITTFGITFFALLPVVVGRNSWMRIVLKNCWFEGASDAAPQRNLDLLLGIKNLVWNYPIKNIFSINFSFINIFFPWSVYKGNYSCYTTCRPVRNKEA